MSVDLNRAGQTLTEAGYDGKFKVHINIINEGMFTMLMSLVELNVIIKNTIIDMSSRDSLINGCGAF